jgi:RNA polymerase sigma factor (sigma-70 family)
MEEQFLQDNLPTRSNWDESLVNHLRNLEAQAWEDLIRIYGSDLRSDIQSSIRRRGLPLDWVADVEQDTWIIAVQKIGEFRWQSIDLFYRWLRVIALNRVRMMKRKQMELLSLDAMEDDDLAGGVALDTFLYTHRVGEISPEQKIINREKVALLEKALCKLKPRDREILLRRIIHGEMPRDLAVVYGLEARSVSMIILRAKHVLETYLAANNNFDEKGDEENG